MNIHETTRPRVGVVGASGYTGRELLTVLARHGGVEVALASSRSEEGQPAGLNGLRFSQASPRALEGLDVVFLSLPHGEAVPWVAHARAAGARVVDLTADHRPGSGRHQDAVYGLTELAGDQLREASLVANPGCYPTGVILALAPLVGAGLLDAGRPVVINAASGTTGAGRSPRRHLLFSEVSGDYRAYGLGNEHRHLLEMQALLPDLQLLFVPHLLPTPRGILETLAVPVRPGVGAAAVLDTWTRAYRAAPTVEVRRDRAPSLRDVTGTDRVVLSAVENAALSAPTLTVVAALDNLGKGAAGQAVQNMNLMLGFEPERGLRC